MIRNYFDPGPPGAQQRQDAVSDGVEIVFDVAGQLWAKLVTSGVDVADLCPSASQWVTSVCIDKGLNAFACHKFAQNLGRHCASRRCHDCAKALTRS
jgi:hypothetical protein